MGAISTCHKLDTLEKNIGSYIGIDEVALSSAIYEGYPPDMINDYLNEY